MGPVERLTGISGVEPLFAGPVFHEQALRLPAPAPEVLRALAEHDVLGGYDLGRDYPELGNAVLVCATEKRTEQEMDAFAEKLDRAVRTRSETPGPAQPRI